MVTHYYDEIPEAEDVKMEKIKQAAIRLEQQAAYLKLQEEKHKLLEEKRRREEIEKRNAKLRKLISLYYVKQTAKAAAAIALSIGTILALLREASYSSPEAAHAYRTAINLLDGLLGSVRHGAVLSKAAVSKALDAISKVGAKAFSAAKDRFSKAAKLKKDSAIIARMIGSEVSFRKSLLDGNISKKRLLKTDSAYSVKYPAYARLASRSVNKAIRIHDARYNDIIGAAAVIGASRTILPVLIPLLKAGITAGVAKAVSTPLLKATEPIIGGLINHLKELAKAKPEDETYIQALCKDIKFQFEKLLAILKREGSYVYGKLNALWQKIKNVFH